MLTSLDLGVFMKCVVIWYSHTGNNRLLALDLQRRLGCDAVEVREARRRSLLTILLDVLLARAAPVSWAPIDLRGFDRAILVGPVWAGRVATPLATFIAHSRAELPPFAFLSLCAHVPGQAERLAAELQRLAGRAPELVEQLGVGDLLPPGHKDKPRYALQYQASESDIGVFELAIRRFIQALLGEKQASGTPPPASARRPAPSASRSPGRPS
jgi:hypothetical protein